MITTSPQTDPHGLTKNQHFVSQAEQRLNALNPSARPENQRIYEFKIVDPDKHKVQLVKPNGRLISNSLSMFDLFSSDIADHGARANLQRVFGTYPATAGVPM